MPLCFVSQFSRFGNAAVSEDIPKAEVVAVTLAVAEAAVGVGVGVGVGAGVVLAPAWLVSRHNLAGNTSYRSQDSLSDTASPRTKDVQQLLEVSCRNARQSTDAM